MKSTKELYGVSADELHDKLYCDFMMLDHKRYCDIRINLLKANLAKVTAKNSTDPLINDILKAVEFWQNLRDEK